MTGFVQFIEYRTSKPDEIAALMNDFRDKRLAAGDGPSPVRGMTCADRDEEGRYCAIIEFASYEEAMENSSREDTGEFAATLMALCDGPPTFRNFDLVETSEYTS
jgi:hypothetical protein